MDTTTAYKQVISHCQDLFLKKTKDYGTAWRIMRLSSITDQLYIKAQRIRTLEVKKVSKVGEGVLEEYIGIVNYCVIAMMQLELGEDGEENLPADFVEAKYNEKVQETLDLMLAKIMITVKHGATCACLPHRPYPDEIASGKTD